MRQRPRGGWDDVVRWRDGLGRPTVLMVAMMLLASMVLAACAEEPGTPDAILDIRGGAAMVKFAEGREFIPVPDGQEVVQGNEVRAGATSQIAVVFSTAR